MSRHAPRPARPALLASLAAIVAVGAVAAPAAPVAAQGAVVLLVRHAEAVPDAGRDPALTAEGRERAVRLRSLLDDVALDAIHSTPLRRTLETAGPLAEAEGLPIERYPPRDLAGLADRIRAAGGRHLVVGHSNTTPEMVRLLGGDPGAPIDEAEHDRVYVLFIHHDRVETVVLRY